ncbi:MAG: type I polyketide synthase, partial [Oligoflexales bacterium]|nr:type I polyketide synthase [Oligoflexales bacterium]
TLNGWGISSDGSTGGIFAPNYNSQARALGRAYERAGYPISSIDFIEGHGTATTVGDVAEIEGIKEVIKQGEGTGPRQIGLTSVKSNVGHTKSASGIIGMIKSVVALHRKVRPPLAGCEFPHELFGKDEGKSLYPIRSGEICEKTGIMRAGVSSMGFGGINVHVTLSSTDRAPHGVEPTIREELLLASSQKSELIVLTASDREDMLKKLKALIHEARHMSIGDLSDLAFDSCRTIEKNQMFRAAIVAHSTHSLLERAKWIRDTIKKHEESSPSFYQSENRFAALAIGESMPVNFGILIPGQGSQFLKMAERLAVRHEWAMDLVNLMDELYMRRYGVKLSSLIFRPIDRARDEEEILEWNRRLEQADVTSAAVCLASTISIEFLKRLGITPKVVCGHSLGELTAFYAASAMTAEELFRLAIDRGSALQAASEKQAGAMLSVSCTLAEAYGLTADLKEYAVIANINSPAQIVFSGSSEGIDEIEKRASLQKYRTVRLPVATAFHSKLVEEGARILAKSDYIDRTVENLSVQVVSSAQGLEAEAGINLLDHFCRQIIYPVDFVNAVSRFCAKVDYMIEAGPGRILSGIVSQIINRNTCYPVLQDEDGSQELNALLALAFAHGLDIDWSVLYHNRLIRPYTPFDKVEFIKNPCERNYAGDGPLPNPMETPLFGLAQISDTSGNETSPSNDNNDGKTEEVDPDEKYALEDALERRNSPEFSEGGREASD